MKKGRTIGIWLILLGLLVNGNFLRAQQDFPYHIENFPFVKYELNRITFPGSEKDLDPFFGKVSKLLFKGEGQVNIVHIGGSHIQADMWSDRMRQRLQTFYPGTRGSRGLLFPFKMAATNNPYNFLPEYTGRWDACRNVQANRNCTLGLTGISVTTYDTTATIKISFRGEGYPRYEFSRLKIFCDLDSSAYSVMVDQPEFEVSSKMNMGKGYIEFSYNGYSSEIKLRIRKTDSLQNHFTLYGISLDNDDPGFIYNAIGVNGASTSSYLRCKLFTRHLSVIKPDLVVFSIGINDANTTVFDEAMYERNYDSLISWVRKANPDVSILLTTNNDSYYKKRYPNRNALAVREVMMRLGKKSNVAVWDMFEIMGGLGSSKEWIKAGLGNTDKIHLLKGGYVHLADLMFNALMQEYDTYLQKRFKEGP